MPNHVSKIKELDERILEFLEADGPAGADRISSEIVGTLSLQRMRDRCRWLEEAGFEALNSYKYKKYNFIT